MTDNRVSRGPRPFRCGRQILIGWAGWWDKLLRERVGGCFANGTGQQGLPSAQVGQIDRQSLIGVGGFSR